MILSVAIVLGSVVALLGDTVSVCSPRLAKLSSCGSPTPLLFQYNFAVVYYHTYWQLFSSILVTDFLPDVIFNVAAVLILDRLIDDSFSLSRYSVIFILTALLGNLFTLAAGPDYVSAGASGGIFGLYAAAFSFVWAQDRRIDRATLVIFVAIFVGSTFVPGLDVNVNWYAHLGGSVGGFIAGPVLYYVLKDKISNFSPLESKGSTRAIVLLGICLIIALSAAQFLLFIST